MGKKEREAIFQLDTDMKLEGENFAPSPTPAQEYNINEGPDEIPESRDYTKDY